MVDKEAEWKDEVVYEVIRKVCNRITDDCWVSRIVVRRRRWSTEYLIYELDYFITRCNLVQVLKYECHDKVYLFLGHFQVTLS